ncbi:MAG: hypothetical protein B9S32_15400 [Verrucomicrobia bacterium Tous-C9LFEB]|nr:MAG: hypothetical protein B9S32_15400 [Verrucomicrobia bacterium Tous-C9LFEB]
MSSTTTNEHKPSILFVDDERNILEGIKRNYRSLRNEYEMNFAESGQEALELLTHLPVDVVVSDMRMPVMDGATLLQEVARVHPETIRIILTGHSDEELILKAVPVTHRFLSKPCTSDDLKQSIDRILMFRDSLHNRSISKFLCGIERLPALPMSMQKLQQEITSTTPSIDSVAELVSQDPALAARILQLANSAFFGPRQVLNCPREATLYLGMETVSALALHVHVFESLVKENSVTVEILRELQSRSAHVADIAYHIALQMTSSEEVAKEAFAGGLLSEIGKLILALAPEVSTDISKYSKEERLSSCEAEYLMAGSSHAEIGAYLLVLWGIPANVVNIVAYHHRPSELDGFRTESVVAVHIAQSLLDIIYEQASPPSMDWSFISSRGFSARMPEWLNYALDCCSVPPDKLQGLLITPLDEKEWNPQ